MKESTPSLLRAIGMLTVFAVAICSHFVARDLAEIGRMRTRAIIKFDLSKPFKTLSEEEKKERGYQIIINNMHDQIGDLHYDMQNRSLMGAVNSSPFLFILGSIGTAFIAGSFCAEWSTKRQKEKLAIVEAPQQRIQKPESAVVPFVTCNGMVEDDSGKERLG